MGCHGRNNQNWPAHFSCPLKNNPGQWSTHKNRYRLLGAVGATFVFGDGRDSYSGIKLSFCKDTYFNVEDVISVLRRRRLYETAIFIKEKLHTTEFDK